MKRKKQKETEVDDFFKDEEEEETGEDYDPEKQLAEDLKAFKDDLKINKQDSVVEDEEEEDEETEDEEEIDFSDLTEDEEEEEENEKKWSIKKKDSRNTNNDEDGEDWLDKDYEEGELAVDVYQDKNNVYVKSTIAGVNVEEIDISIHNDLLTIRGKREQTSEEKGVDYFYQECYWGSFSRSIILPVEIKADKIEAFLKDGILTIVLPKAKKEKKPGIKIKEK